MGTDRRSALPASDVSAGQGNELLELAHSLYDVLTDGAPPAGYHVRRGYAVRDAVSKKPLRPSYTDTWLPARQRQPDGRETERLLNPYVLCQHLRGRYDVAWTAPSWSSLIVLDIDRPNLPDDADLDAVLTANFARDAVLAAVWRAFDCDATRRPVVLTTPGGGYHLYFPVCRTRDPEAAERTWPNGWLREWFEHRLNQAGLDLRPGRLELYPSGVRLRAPCGRGMALVEPQRPDDPDDLRLNPVHARSVELIDGKTGDRKPVLRRSLVPMTRAFLQALEAQRRPVEEWVSGEEARPAWSPVWGPFGDREALAELADRTKQAPSFQGDVPLFQHKEEVQKAAGPLGDPVAGWVGGLLRGRAFYRRVKELSLYGLTDPGTRHDGALKLAWYLGVLCQEGKEEVLAKVGQWLQDHDHASMTRDQSPARFVRQTLREVAHYYDTRIVHCRRGVGVSVPEVVLPPLAAAERGVVDRHVAAATRPAVARVLQYLAARADAQGRIGLPIELSGTLLSTLCGDGRITVENPDGSRSRRRAYVVAIDELVRLGVLALHCDYSTGNHGRQYTCWYCFGSGVLPVEDTQGRRVLAERVVEDGTLRVVATGDRGMPSVDLVTSSPGLPSSSEAQGPWWFRMYARRAFTPAEFFDADDRKVLPGPFRHRFDRSPRGKPPASWPGAETGAPCPMSERGAVGDDRFEHHVLQRGVGAVSSGIGGGHGERRRFPGDRDGDWKQIVYGSEVQFTQALGDDAGPSRAEDSGPAEEERGDSGAGLQQALARAWATWRRRFE
jgi:hypothetical protein